MTLEDVCEDEQEDDDGLESRMTILRDVMLSYDTEALFDIRDARFYGYLKEAVSVMGLFLEVCVAPPGGSGVTEAVVSVSLGSESVTFTGRSGEPDRGMAAICAVRMAMAEAGLMKPVAPFPADGGVMVSVGRP